MNGREKHRVDRIRPAALVACSAPLDRRGGRPPVLLRAVAVFAFLAAGVGGSELASGALRFEPEAALLCTV
jgi:hypothetical protein